MWPLPSLSWTPVSFLDTGADALFVPAVLSRRRVQLHFTGQEATHVCGKPG
jgi:hypothetical protein